MFSNEELLLIKFILTVIKEDSSIGKLNKMQWYELEETTYWINSVLDKLKYIEFTDGLKTVIED